MDVVAVTVDADLCIGSGECARLVPSAFRLDEALGVAAPLSEATSADVAAVREAARSCPTQAIRIAPGDLDDGPSPASGRGR